MQKGHLVQRGHLVQKGHLVQQFLCFLHQIYACMYICTDFEVTATRINNTLKLRE